MTKSHQKSSSSLLLPSDDDEPVSLLSSTNFYDTSVMEGTGDNDDTNNTALARLISNSNNNNDHTTVILHHHNHWNTDFRTATTANNTNRTSSSRQRGGGDGGSHHQDSTISSANRRHHQRDISRTKEILQQQYNRYRSYFIIQCCICFILFSICIWSSYNSGDTWYETALCIELQKNPKNNNGWINDIWNYISLSSYGMITHNQSTNLLSFLQKLGDLSHHHHRNNSPVVSFIIIIICITNTVILPCITMVYLPIRMSNLILLVSTNKQKNPSTKSIIPHRNNHHKYPNYVQRFTSIYEISIRFSFLIIYIMIGIILSNQFLSYQTSKNGSSSNSMNISFDSTIANGLVMYTFGISLAIVCVMMIRSFSNITTSFLLHHGNIVVHNHNTYDRISHLLDPNHPIGENLSESAMYTNNDTYISTSFHRPLMQILEEQAAEVTPLASSTPVVVNKTIQRSFHDHHGTTRRSFHVDTKTHSIPFWKILFVFQCCLLCILLIVPSFCLPIIRFQYDDDKNDSWISDMSNNNNVHQSISLYQIPTMLYSSMMKVQYNNVGNSSRNRITDMMLDNFQIRFSLQIQSMIYSICNIFQPLYSLQYPLIPTKIVFTIETVPSLFSMLSVLLFLVLTTILCPFYAMIIAIRIWMISPLSSSTIMDDNNDDYFDLSPMQQRKGRKWMIGSGPITRRQCRNHLYWIHPVVGSIVVAISLLLLEHIIQHWNVYDMTNLICPNLHSLGEQHCSVNVSSSLDIGAWCYVVHAILLEVFILATLKWS